MAAMQRYLYNMKVGLTMIAILGALLFGLVAVLTILITFGLPLGEFTMGGKYKVLPPKLRIVSGLCVLIQLFAIVIILQTGGLMPLWFPANVTKYICVFFAAYLSLNAIMNVFSTSKKERYVATPLSVVAAVCFWITAFTA